MFHPVSVKFTLLYQFYVVFNILFNPRKNISGHFSLFQPINELPIFEINEENNSIAVGDDPGVHFRGAAENAR